MIFVCVVLLVAIIILLFSGFNFFLEYVRALSGELHGIRDEIRKLNHQLRKPPFPPDIEREP